MKSYWPPSFAVSTKIKQRLAKLVDVLKIKLTVVVVSSPHGLWIVRGCVLAKPSLASIVNCSSTMHALPSISTAAVKIGICA